MDDSLSNELAGYQAQKILLKNKMFALLKRQAEIMEFLEYSMDQDNARANHLVYASNIFEISRIMFNIVAILNSIDHKIAELEPPVD